MSTTDNTEGLTDGQVVGAITPAADSTAADSTTGISAGPPFPRDLLEVHAIDSQSEGATIVKTTEDGYSVQLADFFSDGTPIPDGDLLSGIPVGSSLLIGKDGATKILLTIAPFGGREQPLVTFGPTLVAAIQAAWPWLSSEGHGQKEGPRVS